MNSLVITTRDITPEVSRHSSPKALSSSLTSFQQWADFAEAAALYPDGPDGERIIPYVLVHSRTQDELDKSETESIPTILQSDFKGASWPEIRDTFHELSKPVAWTIYIWFFLILDEQSTRDRKVVLMIRGREWRTKEDTVWRGCPVMREGLTEFTTWKKHRVPFEEIWDHIALLTAKGGLEEAEPHLQEVIREKVEK
jgi:hypothetical protein